MSFPCRGVCSGTKAVLLLHRPAQQRLDLGHAARSLESLRQRQQILPFDLLADRHAQAKATLPAPALLLRGAWPRPPQLLGAVPLQVSKGQQAQTHPPLHTAKVAQAVAAQTQDRFQLLKEEFDLPSQVV